MTFRPQIPLIALACLVLPAVALGKSKVETITMAKAEWQAIQDQVKGRELLQLESNNGLVQVQLSEGELLKLSHLMHEKFQKCGGFFAENPNAPKALAPLSIGYDNEFYRLDQEEQVLNAFAEVEEDKMRATILKLSSYRNRYYQSQHGVDSQKWVASHWLEIAQGIGATVEIRRHSRWAQPSVILTVPGKTLPNEVIVLGGHGDSIQGYGRNNEMLAPGADDNASGIATITEVLRVLAKANYAPDRTVKFMAYAAEEVGLRGSDEIASDFRSRNVAVKAVMQLDMTNFGVDGTDMVLMSDYTNNEQNQFMSQLLENYLPQVRWNWDQCGYACSDHASWTRQGYRASIPFEAPMNDYNPAIHSTRDLIGESGGTAEHAVPFAKIALAFVMELASL